MTAQLSAAAAARADAAPESSGQFISFAIGDDQYGVDIMAVREIKGWSQITRLPQQPDYVRGVLNLRGAMIAIIDLRCRFGQGTTDATPLHVVIVVQIGARPVGLLADRVLDIVPVERARVQPVPQISHGAGTDFLAGLVSTDNGMIALIDLPHLLSDADNLGLAAMDHAPVPALVPHAAAAAAGSDNIATF